MNGLALGLVVMKLVQGTSGQMMCSQRISFPLNCFAVSIHSHFAVFFFHFQFYKPVLVLSFSVACGMNIRVRDLRVANACEVAP